MDIAMPVMNGYECTKMIREKEHSIYRNEESVTIIGLSAHSSEGYKDKGFEAGMNKFCNLF